ncbi:MAG TPA: hypothetical protein PLW50_00480 [Smithellaceae bacterium]|nr:hypothetical protein [Smithellaceae bacterium]
MADYFFDVNKSLAEITANRDFQSACFDSIRGGNPLTVYVNSRSNEAYEQEITCLEYILDAIVDDPGSTPIIDDEFFENLATINIRDTTCHIHRRTSTDNGAITTNEIATCMPKIIDAYSAVSKNGDFGLLDADGHTYVYGSQEAKKKVQGAMREIVSKYPNLLLEDNCEVSIPRNKYNKFTPNFYSYASCFEKLMYEGTFVDFIDATSLPSDFFDSSKCYKSATNPTKTSCIEQIIKNAWSGSGSYGYTIFNENSKNLLESVIKSKKFGRNLFNPDADCGNIKCIDTLFNIVNGTEPCSMATSLLSSYSDSNGIVDVESGESPFSGLKCANSTNCLDTLIRKVSSTYDGNGDSHWRYISEIIKNQPRYSGVCGSLRLISLVNSGANNFDIEQRMDEISTGFNPRYKFLDKAAMETCMSSVGGKEHSVNGVDYAIELGVPVVYNFARGGMTVKDFYKVMEGVSCKSIYTGETMPCIQKLTKELMTIKTSDSIIMSSDVSNILTRILDSGADAYDYTFPEGFPWFTDYLSDGLLYATIIGSDETRLAAVAMLEKMITMMGTYYANTHKLIESDSFPRMRKIGDIIYEAYDRDSKNGYNRKNLIKKPANVKHTLNNCFVHSEEDVINTINSGIFNRGLAIPSLEVLSDWYYEFEDSSVVTRIILDSLRKNEEKIKMGILGKIAKDPTMPDDTGSVNVTEKMAKMYELAYGTSIKDILSPSKQSRILYDKYCFKRSGIDHHDFMENVYNDVEGNSKLRYDPNDLVGVYDITVGDTGLFSDDHIYTYATTMYQMLYGSHEVIGSPYVQNIKENAHPVPVGLIAAVQELFDYEFVGQRKENIKGKLSMSVTPEQAAALRTTQDDIVRQIRANGNDFTFGFYYVTKDGEILDRGSSSFNFMEWTQKAPKKLKKKLQEKYPILFGQLELVSSYEKMRYKEAIEAQKSKRVQTYKMSISNKPVDVLRSAACQKFDKVSCMSLFGGGHNESLEGYIDGSYIAYLTKDSEYEPQWLARLFMHRCTNCKCVSIQDSKKYYDSSPDPYKYHPNWDLLYDAVKVVLADKGMNVLPRMRECEFEWGTTSDRVREDVMENGDSRCDEEISNMRDECISECEDECSSDSKIDAFRDEISSDVQDEIDRRYADAVAEHTVTNEDGEPELDVDEDDLRSEITDDVYETYENELLDEKIQDCKDDCDENCDYVGDDFDCWEYLTENGYVDDDGGGIVSWVDVDYAQPLKKGSNDYLGTLVQRTSQSESSDAFVKRVKSDF